MNDEVLVMFVHGDVHHPVVVGQMWNGRDVPPYDNADGKNNLRFFRSRRMLPGQPSDPGAGASSEPTI